MIDLYHATRAELNRLVWEQAETIADQEGHKPQAAERSLRHLVVARQISGGSRTARGTATRHTLASGVGFWRPVTQSL